jgi:hypothetical protein
MFDKDAPKKLNLLIHPSLFCELGPQAEHIRRCVHMALLCVEEDPADRPSMTDVVLMLNNGVGSRCRFPADRHPGTSTER